MCRSGLTYIYHVKTLINIKRHAQTSATGDNSSLTKVFQSTNPVGGVAALLVVLRGAPKVVGRPQHVRVVTSHHLAVERNTAY